MARHTSFTLGEHFERFIAARIADGRYSSASEVVRSGLRLLEEHEAKVDALRQALIDSETGDEEPLDMQQIIRDAREKAGLEP